MSEETTPPATEPAPAPASPAPTIGRIVHFRDGLEKVVPAIVAGVNEDGSVAIHAFYPNGVYGFSDHASVTESDGVGAGWFWPPR